MRLLIVRHGDPDYEHDTLTEKGWREAELLSERLSNFYRRAAGEAVENIQSEYNTELVKDWE